MTDDQLIRQAITAEADQAAHPEAVLARLRARRARRAWPTFAVIAAAVAVVAAVVVVPSVLRDSAPPPEQGRVAAPPTPATQNVLLLGDDGQGIFDTMVLLRLRADGTVRGIALPRDTYAEVPGSTSFKIDQVYLRARAAALESGADEQAADKSGMDTLYATVRALTGVAVDHHARVDLPALAALTDAAGGVEVCLTSASKDAFSGSDLPAGEQTLTGPEALAYLRQRHGLPNGDLDRVKRAQLFLHNLSAKLLSTPATLQALATTAKSLLRTDPTFDLPTFVTLVAGPPVPVATIPVGDLDVDTPDSGLAIAVDPAEVTAFTARYLSATDAPAPPAPGSPEVPCVH